MQRGGTLNHQQMDENTGNKTKERHNKNKQKINKYIKLINKQNKCDEFTHLIYDYQMSTT